MKSVVHEFSQENFPRIRVGIGRPVDEFEAIDYVIGQLPEGVYERLEKGIEKAVEASVDYIKNGIDHAMNNYNN